MWPRNILFIYSIVYASTVLSLEPVTIFVSRNCMYCALAQNYLEKYQIAYTVVDITHNKLQRLALYEKTGQSTVPYVFNCHNFIGGYSQLIKINLERLQAKCA